MTFHAKLLWDQNHCIFGSIRFDSYDYELRVTSKKLKSTSLKLKSTS